MYNWANTRKACWLAFALALTPVLMQLVATILTWPAISTAIRRQRGLPETRSPWFYLLLLLLAFGLMLYQTGWVAVLYIPDPEGDILAESVDVILAESVEVLGVTIPFELGERVNAFVNSAVFLLIALLFLGYFALILVRVFTQMRVKASAAGWAFALFILFFLGMAVWNAWRTLPYQLDNLRALF